MVSYARRKENPGVTFPMMTAARTAFHAFIGRLHTWATRAVSAAHMAEAEAAGYGQPEMVESADGVEIRLYAFIEQHMVCEMWGLPGSIAVSDIGFARALDKAKATGKAMRLRINSPGGDVFAGVAIANLLREAGVPVTIDGTAASIASVIAAASPMVTMLPGTTMMVHQPWSMAAGNAQDFRNEATVLDKLLASMLDVYVSGSTATRQEWQALLVGKDGADGTWLSAQDCLALGIADMVPEQEQDTPSAEQIERRKMIAELHNVRLPKSMAETAGQPLTLTPDDKGPEVTALGDQGKPFQPGVRVSHRPGTFYVNRK